MSDDDLNTLVNIGGGNTVSLADIAGIDMEGVKEVRFTLFPIGSYEWKALPGELLTIGEGEDAKAMVRFPLECVSVFAIQEGEVAEEAISKKHTQGFQIKTMDDLGRAKAFLVDAQFKGSGKLSELLAEFEGHVFKGNIKHTKDKNDKEKIYANIEFPKKSK